MRKDVAVGAHGRQDDVHAVDSGGDAFGPPPYATPPLAAKSTNRPGGIHEGAFKNAIDFLFQKWNNTAAGFVDYGKAGGVRAAEHLRLVMSRDDKTPLELFLAGVRGGETRLRRRLSRQVELGRP